MSRLRYKLVLVLLTAFISFLNLKVYINISTNQYAVKSVTPALRGSIYDSRGRLLATSEIVYTAYLDLDYLRSFAGNGFKKDPDFVKMLMNFGIAEKISELDSRKILRLGSVQKREEAIKKIPTIYLKFVSIEPEERRNSISDFGLSMIIGKTDQRYGISGVEAYFDKILRPVRNGIVQMNYSGFLGRRINTLSIDPQNGKNVRITIDSGLQRELYKLASDYKEKKKATEVGILIMESKTGKLRVALTTQSWPTYYMGYIEPGSTIKPILFASAIELGLVSSDSQFYCPGYVQPIEGLDLKIKDLEVHKDINLYDGLVHSCNVASVLTVKKIVDTFGTEKLYEILSSFGFGKETGIELSEEIPGKLNPPDKWYRADWAFIGIGQSIGVTPIQLLAAFNTIVNDGEYVQPTLDDEKVPNKKRLLSKNTTDIVKNMLFDVVEKGTGINARIEGVKILGKTGTAQKNQKKDVTAIFVGQVYLDIPYTVMVWVDSPQSEKLSSIIAAPFFKDVVLKIKEFQDKYEKKNISDFSSLPDMKGWTLKHVNEFLKSSTTTDIAVRIHSRGLYVSNYTLSTTNEATVIDLWLTPTPPID